MIALGWEVHNRCGWWGVEGLTIEMDSARWAGLGGGGWGSQQWWLNMLRWIRLEGGASREQPGRRGG